MPFHRISALVVPLLVSLLGCTTVYQPPEQPPTEATLESAIRTLQESEAEIEMLEDGLQLVAYVYEWREPIEPTAFYGDRRFGHGSSTPSGRSVRMLVGPARDVYLPYARIEKVSARSWPLWSGVEIDVSVASDLAIEGPLVIEASDVEEAQRLTDSIDIIRRVRQLSAAIEPVVAEPEN
jgi:hypothetical protein